MDPERDGQVSRYSSINFNILIQSLGAFLLDRGLNIRGEQNFPWRAYSPKPSQPPTFLPVVQYNEPDQRDKVIDLSTIYPTLNSNRPGYILHPYHPMKECLSVIECELTQRSFFRAEPPVLSCFTFLGPDAQFPG